ncbi:GAP family protein [Streptomyces erythrochromogenes]|uniref:GAP family protein n=1 Tax=Streptomyces erythrochromogenes TaxID=285574 RepID=A0ABZ1QCE9_9ACTN|nr:GAP family protein [Streptomyces erythrochromogenes]MCX5585603.1 GAP family protein [Streptomyces erythrochromogenes]
MVLDLLVIGLIITLYPLPVMAFVLVVSAPRGLWKGLAFILAWFGCLVAVIAIVMFLTGGEPPPPRSPPATAGLVIRLALGIGLVAYAEYRRRRAPGTAAPSGDSHALTSRMDQASAWSAAGLAVLLQPWGMVGAAAATVVEADLSQSSTFLALFGFCLLASSTLLAMELYMVFAPERAALVLTGLRSWLSDHKDPAIVFACLTLGLWLVGRSLYDLTS